MTTSKFTDDQIKSAIVAAQTVAAQATANYLAKYGDRDACGFASVQVSVKASTKLGKQLIAQGFSKYWGRGLQYWNPGGSGTQSITAKEEGAYAFASELKTRLGIQAHVWSRLD